MSDAATSRGCACNRTAAILTILLFGLAGTPVGICQDIELQRVLAEGMKERVAVGPWKQVAAIESCSKSTVGSNDPAIPDVLGNESIVAFLDDHRFVVADGLHPVRVFNAEDGKLLLSFGQPEKDGIYSRHFVLSPDGGRLMILPDAAPEIWDTRTGKVIAKLPYFEDKYDVAAFVAGGDALATYRGQRARGDVPGNLQIWDVDRKTTTVSLRKSIDADQDARGLALVGPFVWLEGYRHSEIFDAASFQVVLQQSSKTDELFLYLEPSETGTRGELVSLELPTLMYLARSIPGGDVVRRWNCPFVGNHAKPNDNRYQAHYTVSPKHTVIAISQEGRANFFRLRDNLKIGSVSATDPFDHPHVIFIDELRAFVTSSRPRNPIRLIEISTGRELAAIPEQDFSPVLSPDHRHLIARRLYGPDPAHPEFGNATMDPQGPVVLWRNTQE